MNIELYNEISSLNNLQLIKEKLSSLSEEMRNDYKKMGNAIRNKIYRDKNKEKINKDRADKRATLKPVININESVNKVEEKEKPIVKIIADDSVPILKKINRRPAPLNKNTNLSEATLKIYIGKLKLLYKKYKGKELDDNNDIIKLLRGKKHSVRKIKTEFKFMEQNFKDIVENNYKDIQNIYSIFAKVYGMSSLVTKLYPYVLESKKNYEENRSNVICNNEVLDTISFKKEDILNNLSNLPNDTDKILYLLMFMLPTRRLHDYRLTKIAKSSIDIKIKSHNWYYDGNIYINNTKNKEPYIVNLPIEIINIINKLPKDYEYIMGKEYSKTGLSHKFNVITKKLYDYIFTSRDIRHIYSGYINKQGGKYKERLLIAKAMGNSVIENLKYCY